MTPLSESLLTSTKISNLCTNANSYLNDSNFWHEKDFFITFSPNEISLIPVISFIPVFWYFIKEIVLYDIEYDLNFNKNAKNESHVTKNKAFGMLLSKLTHGENLI